MDLLPLIGQLVIDTSASWGRMFVALAISVVLSLAIGVLAATSRTAERIILPVVDVLQTLPILAFFPFAIFIFVAILPGYIGINAAVIFLIVTSMLWNIIFGVYESIKTLPAEFFEVVELYHFDFWTRLKKLYIPASFPRLVEQSILSWSIGLFYLVTSEIFSIGNPVSGCPAGNCTVTYGIGAWLVEHAPGVGGGTLQTYLIGVGVFVIFVIGTRFLFFKPFENYSTRYLRPQAKLSLPKYRQFALDIVRQALRTRYISKIHKATKEIRIVKIRAREHRAGLATTNDHTKAYIAIVAVIVAVIFYVFASNPVLIGYEYEVLPALAFSFARIWLAFLLITLISVPLCVYLIFMSKKTSSYITFFQILASIPATILLPLLVEGLQGATHQGELVAFAIFFLSGIWYTIFSMVASTRTLSSNIFDVKRLFGIKGWAAWKEIYLRAILPGFITGALTGIAAEWNASIVAEYFTATGVTGNNITTSVATGIGKLLDLALSPGGEGLGLMAVALLNLVVMILIINTFVWKRAYKNIAKMYG